MQTGALYSIPDTIQRIFLSQMFDEIIKWKLKLFQLCLNYYVSNDMSLHMFAVSK